MNDLRLVEVGPRDGLQNEKMPIDTELKLDFVQKLIHAGCHEIEATSFVSPKWVPQLADSSELWRLLPRSGTFSALVPNARGLDTALSLGVQRIAVFTAASEDFVQKNINMTISDSLDVFRDVINRFRSETAHGWVRGYVSTAFACPYAGRISPAQVVPVVEALLELGVDEISLGDTIGVACPTEVRELTNAVAQSVPLQVVNYHFHDTNGTAIANIARAYDLGIRSFDSSAGGLGGCPYAPGAGGNVASEDVVYFFERSGVTTGLDLDLLSLASLKILEKLGYPPRAKAQLATLAKNVVC